MRNKKKIKIYFKKVDVEKEKIFLFTSHQYVLFYRNFSRSRPAFKEVIKCYETFRDASTKCQAQTPKVSKSLLLTCSLLNLFLKTFFLLIVRHFLL